MGFAALLVGDVVEQLSYLVPYSFGKGNTFATIGKLWDFFCRWNLEWFYVAGWNWLSRASFFFLLLSYRRFHSTNRSGLRWSQNDGHWSICLFKIPVHLWRPPLWVRDARPERGGNEGHQVPSNRSPCFKFSLLICIRGWSANCSDPFVKLM